MQTGTGRKFGIDISIWAVISAVVILIVIAAVMTLTHFQRQKGQAAELLLEKGATLIRSFEAGLRSQSSDGADIFQMQKLLMETAQQPDIDYIVITDSKGNILADSDPSMVGRQYGLDLDTGKIALSKDKKWRQAANPEGAGTFEVYRGFFPQERFDQRSNSARAPAGGNMIIYVGFNMATIEKADKEDTRNTIIIALILLLIGSSAIISLFLAQAYRITRSSLSRMTVFSEALVKNMPIGMIALDEDGQVADCNEKAGLILNIDCPHTIGKKANSALPEPVREIFGKLSPASSMIELDLHITSGQKESQTLEIVAASMNIDGNPAGKIILLRDVTNLRQLEAEVVKSRHLTSISSLAAGVAHEIRNPLSSIKGFAVYFKERFAGNDEGQKTAETMIAEVDRLNRVISQLIEFARPLTLNKKTVSLSGLIEHTLNLLAAQASNNRINIVTDIPPDLPPTEVDPDKVKQVLLNVFLNAMEAMKDGGNLKVKLTPEKDYTSLTVTDTGKGIEKMDLPNIYDPYFTSKPAGTGLGLAVVQKIMDAHGGTIQVESVAGEGTVVHLQFPGLPGGKKEK